MNNQIKLFIFQSSKKGKQLERQRYHIQTLMQENGKLDIKLLPKKIEYHEPWWRF